GNEDLSRVSQFHAVETWLRNSDHRHVAAIDHQSLADNRAVRGEAGLPEAVAEYGQRMAARNSVIIRSEGTAQDGLYTQHREIAARHKFGGYALSSIPIAQAGLKRKPAKHSRKDLVVIAEIAVHRIRDRIHPPVAAVVLPPHRKEDHFLRLLHGKQPQHNLIEQAEDGGVCADSERE